MKKLAVPALSLLLPALVLAQGTGGSLSNLQTLVGQFGDIVKILVPIVFTLAVLGFFWGLVMYIFGKEDNKDQPKKTMLWGIIAIFVMSAVWGLVTFLGQAVGVNTKESAVDVKNLVPKF